MSRASDRHPDAKSVLLKSLPFWSIVPAGAYYFGGPPALYGSLIGLSLVVGYFAVAVFTTGRAFEKSVGMAQVLVIGGFWLRLAVLGVVLYLVSLVKEINLISVGVTFAVGYPIVLVMEVSLLAKGGKGGKSGDSETNKKSK